MKKKRLMDYTAGYRVLIVLGILCSAGEAVLELLLPQIMSDIVDIGIKNADRSYILMAGLKMVIMALVSLALGVGAAVLASKAGMGFGANLRAAEYRQVQRFSFANIRAFFHGLSDHPADQRCEQPADDPDDGYADAGAGPGDAGDGPGDGPYHQHTAEPGVPDGDPAAGAGCGAGAAEGGAVLHLPAGGRCNLNLVVQEDLNAIRVVKSFVREDVEKEKFAGRNEKLKAMAEKAFGFVVMFMPLIFLLMGGTIVAVLWIGGNYVFEGSLLSGDLIAFFTYVSEILMSLMMVSMVMMMLTRSIACGRRVMAVLNEEPQITDEKAREGLAVTSGSIDFDHVYFRYNENGQTWNLEDIDLHIPSGATVGILGGTGSAKTTLVSLIPRLYEATEGSVRVGGHDVREYSMKQLRDACAMVLQKNTLFSGTIKDNLRWGDANATDEEMRSACRIACAEEFIEKMPEGYDTYIEQGGTNVSGGQKQRLCIARGHSQAAQGADPGRLHLGGGHGHGRSHSSGAALHPAGDHEGHYRPAHLLRAGRGHHRGAGRRQNIRCGQPCRAAENQRNLQRSV